METDARNLSVAALRDEIRWVSAHGYDATAMRVDLAAKLAAPLGCLILPAVVFLYALWGPPYPKTAAALVSSVAVGVGSLLLGDLAASLGYGGAIPPWLAGLAPTAIFAALSSWLALRLWRRA